MSVPSNQVSKSDKVLPVAASADVIEIIDERRGALPFKPSRSRFAGALVWYALVSLAEGRVTLQELGSKYSVR